MLFDSFARRLRRDNLRRPQSVERRLGDAGIEPVAHYRSLPIGALPLWRRELRSLLLPQRRGKILFPHPFKVRFLAIAIVHSTKSRPFWSAAAFVELGDTGFEPVTR